MGGTVPDFVDLVRGFMAEVKNVNYLGLTRQIRVQLQVAQESGLQYQLWIRGNQGTELSTPLWNKVLAGEIELRCIPGTC